MPRTSQFDFYKGPETQLPIVNLNWAGALNGLEHIEPIQPLIRYLGFRSRQEFDLAQGTVNLITEHLPADEFVPLANALPRDVFRDYQSPQLKLSTGRYDTEEFVVTLRDENKILCTDYADHHDVHAHAIADVVYTARIFERWRQIGAQALEIRRADERTAALADFMKASDRQIRNPSLYHILTGTQDYKGTLDELTGHDTHEPHVLGIRQRAYDLSAFVLKMQAHLPGPAPAMEAGIDDHSTWQQVADTHLYVDYYGYARTASGLSVDTAMARNVPPVAA